MNTNTPFRYLIVTGEPRPGTDEMLWDARTSECDGSPNTIKALIDACFDPLKYLDPREIRIYDLHADNEDITDSILGELVSSFIDYRPHDPLPWCLRHLEPRDGKPDGEGGFTYSFGSDY